MNVRLNLVVKVRRGTYDRRRLPCVKRLPPLLLLLLLPLFNRINLSDRRRLPVPLSPDTGVPIQVCQDALSTSLGFLVLLLGLQHSLASVSLISPFLLRGRVDLVTVSRVFVGCLERSRRRVGKWETDPGTEAGPVAVEVFRVHGRSLGPTSLFLLHWDC